jgi:hypothetical protein
LINQAPTKVKPTNVRTDKTFSGFRPFGFFDQ